MLLWKDGWKPSVRGPCVTHEIIESIYVTDPNGYMVEIGWQLRPLGEMERG